MADTVIPKNSTTHLTAHSDPTGHVVQFCNPDWFDPDEQYSVANAPPRAATLKFTGKDLNFAARVLYAEASGSGALPDVAERNNEKMAIINVFYFRINRKGYRSQKHATFIGVCSEKNQFQSVFANEPKFSNSTKQKAREFSNSECTDLCEALSAIKAFLQTGPSENYCYDNFRAYDRHHPKLPGHRIGNTRFWLSTGGNKMYTVEK